MENNKFIQLVRKKLRKGKFRGGYGFRDLNDFNLTLLAKGWRLIHNPDNMWSRLLKGLYFPYKKNCKQKKAIVLLGVGRVCLLVAKHY